MAQAFLPAQAFLEILNGLFLREGELRVEIHDTSRKSSSVKQRRNCSTEMFSRLIGNSVLVAESQILSQSSALRSILNSS